MQDKTVCGTDLGAFRGQKYRQTLAQTDRLTDRQTDREEREND